MSAISNTSYILPPRRPWDPSRFTKSLEHPNGTSKEETADEWKAGKVVKGHPNICPLLDFFEDNHYYYLILPSSVPEHLPNEPANPSDLFDLVETYPQGLPPSLIRTYLGQIADAVTFLHSHGIGACWPYFEYASEAYYSYSTSRHKRRKCSIRSSWKVYIDRLWKLRTRQEERMGYI